jgi:Ca-activated chloride channel family protein
MSFAHPSFLLPAVSITLLFAALYAYAERRRIGRALKYSNLAFLIEAARPRTWPARLAAAAWILAVGLVALAFAGPRVHAAIPVRGGSVVLCVDTSGSMAAADVQPTRADAALAAMRAFVDRTPEQTAIGLVAFAGGAQEISPPTRDRDQVRTGLAAIPAPNGATAIGDALTVAQRMLPKSGHRVVVLITDGENNAGTDPMQAARMLAARGITLYTIGIGTNTGALIPGTLQTAGIDEDALRAYARATGGAYSRADDATQLREALARLGRTTSFQRGTIDVSLAAAAAGALLMILTFLWTRSI